MARKPGAPKEEATDLASDAAPSQVGATAATQIQGPSSTKSTSTETVYTDQPQPRQPRPLKVDAHYPVARMTYLTISTEDLATLGVSSGIGSIALSFTFFFAKEAYSTQLPLAIAGAIGFGAIALTSYLFFGGYVVRIRRRSNLTWWHIFGE